MLFDELDANTDGALTFSEIKNGLERNEKFQELVGEVKAKEVFARLDGNADGAVSKEEFMALFESRNDGFGLTPRDESDTQERGEPLAGGQGLEVEIV